MKVLNNRNQNYSDDADFYLEFEDHDDGDDSEVLYYGYASCHDKANIELYKDSKQIFWQMEQPCGLMDPGKTEFHVNIGENFDRIYSTCPYTAEWLNKIKYTDGRYRVSIFPHNAKYAIKKEEEVEREFDAITWGNPHVQDVYDIIETISKFKYNFYTLGLANLNAYKKYVTGMKMDRKVMWETLRKTKIMVTSNLLYVQPRHVAATKGIPQWELNEAFSHVDQGIMPQIKTRCIEAVFNKTLLLVKRDPWRVLEKWFVAGEDFLYYDDKNDLYEKIKEISNNWDDYKHIPESAYERALNNYTTDHLMEAIKNDVTMEMLK